MLKFIKFSWLQCANQESSREELNAEVKRVWSGHSFEIEELIYHCWGNKNIGDCADSAQTKNPKNILIFIDRDLDVDWITNFDINPEAAAIVAQATALESMPHKHLSKKSIIAFKRLIGLSILSSINGSGDIARKQILDARGFIENRVIECSRSWILQFASLFFLMTVAFLYCQNSFLILQIGGEGSLALSSAFAVLGAYLSLVLKIGSEKMDSSSGLYLHFLEVFSKFLVAAICGAVSLVLIRSNISPEFVKVIKADFNGILIVGFLSGFSERFIPNIISSYGDKNAKE